MIDNLKALIVVVTIAFVIFAMAKPVCLRFMEEIDFVRRRNIWFVLTIAAFISPSFWLFAAIAAIMLVRSARSDSNPLALYMLVFCIIPPTISFEIPIVGVNALFRMNYIRLLSLCMLIPLAWRLIQLDSNSGSLRFTRIDIFVAGFAVLHLALLFPYESITQNMRRWLLYFLDVVVLYFVSTRACKNRKCVFEVMITFCMLCAILASLAVFEAQRHWLLYDGISKSWGEVLPMQYATRDGSLRAQVTAGQSIPLGLLFAFGFGLGLYFLGSLLRSWPLTAAYGVLMWAGMIAAHARAPWVVALIILFAYVLLGPNGLARSSKLLLVSTVFSSLILISPVGDRVIDNLPFIGKVGAENVEYRQELAKQSWEQIKQNPLFGNPLVLKNLESLRQGEGIIDLLNGYTTIAMYYGIPALLLFLGPYFVCLWNGYQAIRNPIAGDHDLVLLGAITVACCLGFMFAIGAGGFGPCPTNFSIVVIGLSACYSSLGRPKKNSTQSRQRSLRDKV